MNLSRRAKILLSILLILFISIPITLGILQKPQNERSNAAATTTLSLVPQPGSLNSITKNKGDDVPINVTLDPGSNIITILRMEVSYPQDELEPDPDKDFFTLAQQPAHAPHFDSSNTQITPTGTGKMLVVLSTDNSPSSAINSSITVGTFHFKAMHATADNTPAEVKFTSETKISSIGSADAVKENVLNSSVPAEITIKDAGAPSGPGTRLSATVLLDGIGIAGDTANPNNNDLSNKDPKTPNRTLKVFVYDANHQPAATGEGTISYIKPGDQENDNNVGKFMGPVTLNKQLTNGQYTIAVKSDRYLRKSFPSPIAIDNSTDNPLPQITLVGGDVTGDNAINADDYHVLFDCGFGELNPLPMTNPSSLFNSDYCKSDEAGANVDLNDDGIINAFDYNLFIREFPVGNGD